MPAAAFARKKGRARCTKREEQERYYNCYDTTIMIPVTRTSYRNFVRHLITCGASVGFHLVYDFTGERRMNFTVLIVGKLGNREKVGKFPGCTARGVTRGDSTNVGLLARICSVITSPSCMVRTPMRTPSWKREI